MLQPFANHAIGAQQVGRRDTLAIRRVGHHDGRLLWLREVLEVLLVDGDVGRESGSLHIQAGRVDSFHVDIVAIDVVLELAFGRVVIIDTVEEVGIEVGPLLEGKFLAEESRRHVAGYKCSLDGQRATATHRVDEVGLALPACHHDHAGSQHLVEGSVDTLLAVAATMERLTAGVEAQCALVLGDMDVQAQVGVGDRDVGSLAGLLAELVDDGVLHLVADKLRVSELLGEDDGIHRKRLVLSQILVPVDVFHGLVHLVGAMRLEAIDGLENLDGRMELEVSPIHHLLVTCKRYHSSTNFYIVGP